MKKLTALIFALALLVSLCACSSQARGAAGSDASPEAGTVSQATGEDSSQNTDPGEEPPVTPAAETKAPESNEDVQPSADVPEPPADVPEPPADVPEPPAGDPEPPASEPKTAPVPAPEPEPVPAAPPTSAPTSVPAPETTEPDPVPPPAPEPAPAADPKTAAQGLVGHPVSELYAAIGKPISSDYAPGCLEPDSEDGELVYSGFTVYTVRTATREYVYDVL